MITNYILIELYNIKSLQDNVNNFLELGYQPLGGVSLVWDSKQGSVLYAQAIVKYE